MKPGVNKPTRLTIELDPKLGADLQAAARLTGDPPVRVIMRALRGWLADHQQVRKERTVADRRLRGFVPCRVLKPIGAAGRNEQGAKYQGRWERGEVAWLEPDAARKFALASRVEVLPVPEDEEGDDGQD